MSNSRVAIFVWGVAGGAFARVAAGLSKGFLDHGLKVDVLYVHKDDYAQDLDFPSGARLHHLGTRRTVLSIRPLARYLRSSNPKALISLSWVQNPPAVLATILSRWKGILLLNEASSMSYKASIEHRGDIRFRYMPSVARFLYPKAHGLVVPSDDVRQDLADKIGLGRRGLSVRTIWNPISIEDVRLRAAGEPNELRLAELQKPIILSVGRLARQKNHALLIRAFAILRKERPATLLILGSGPEGDRLMALANELGITPDVVMPGMVRNPYPYMAHADAFALSSEEEGFGLVLVEAMALGLPIVATRCPGGPVEILEDGRCGVLVPLGDEHALAEAMGEILDDESRTHALVQAALQRAEEFSPSRITSQWISFMTEIERSL